MENSKMYHILLEPKICNKVGLCIGVDWRSFARQLNFDDTEIGHFESDNKNTHEKAMAVLRKLKEKTGDLTWEQLKKPLAEIQRNDIIKEIEGEFKLALITHQGIKT